MESHGRRGIAVAVSAVFEEGSALGKVRLAALAPLVEGGHRQQMRQRIEGVGKGSPGFSRRIRLRKSGFLSCFLSGFLSGLLRLLGARGCPLRRRSRAAPDLLSRWPSPAGAST